MDVIADERPPTPAGADSVTVCVAWKIRPGQEQAFEEWLAGVGQVAAAFAGHQGLNVLRPAETGSSEYVYIFRFDSYAHLQAWEESDERQRWVAKAQALTEGSPRKQVMTGLEYWFTLPEAPGAPAPPRLKMATITLLAIYPLSLALPAALAPLLEPVPPLLRGLLISALLVLLMTYVVMPRVTRLFAAWLYPRVRAA